jgi:hypothetical protein
VIPQGTVEADSYHCLECHANIGHVYEQPSSKVSGWYSVGQAAAGKTPLEDSCPGCRSAKLEGGVGPAMSGATGKQRFGPCNNDC